MQDPTEELLALGRSLGFRKSKKALDGPLSDASRIMHGVETNREISNLHLQFEELQDYKQAKRLVDKWLIDERIRALKQSSRTMYDILDNKSKLVERLRATKMSTTIPVEQQYQKDLQQLLEACAADLHSAEQDADAVQWAFSFTDPTMLWEERTRALSESAQALVALHKQQQARTMIMGELVRSACCQKCL